MGNKKGNKRSGKGKLEGSVIKKVDKEDEKEFSEFKCAIPSDEEMNAMFIPQPGVVIPSIDWFLDGRNLTETLNPEWAEAWNQFCIFKELDWFESDFSSQPEGLQKEGIDYMVDFVRKTRRSLLYKKYEYALQKKKKEADEIDKLERQVELIEGRKDKGKGKVKKEQAIHGGGESAKSGGESGEGKTMDEAKEDEGVVAGAEEKKGVKEKVVEDLADWSTAGDDEYALQKKKKEGDEIDKLERQVELIEGRKDKGKGKVKKEQAIHGGGESAKSGGESGEGKTMDEAKEDEGVVAGAEEKKGVKEKVVEILADWSTAGDDDVDDGGESAKSGGESGEGNMVDEAKEDEAVVEVDDTLGFLFSPGSLAAFPLYEDGDNVACYSGTFSLKDWMLEHRSPDSRWLSSWPDMGLNNVHWSGDRLKRESLIVMQSLLSAVLDYHEHYGPHGNLSNHANIILSQRVDSFGGSQKVWFQIQLPEPNSLDPKILNDQFEVDTYLTEDMVEVDRIFREILEGRDLDVDMKYLLNFLLKRYPFNDTEAAWRTQLLRNFPGFWYGQQRASFTINVYYNWMCDSEKSLVLLKAIKNVQKVAKVSSDLKCIDWIKKISTDSIFYETLIFSRKVTEDKEDDDPKPQYSEGSPEKVLKYMRDTLHHYRETHGGGSMKIRQIELYLSNLFKGFIMALYMSMCERWIFLS